MNREELIKSALINQRHLALETPVEDLETLPTDLLTVLVDFANSTDFKLHGFVRAPRTKCRYSYHGEMVDVCPIQMLCKERVVAIRPETGTPISSLETKRFKQVLASEIFVSTEEHVWWHASVEGNGIVLESELKERGFPSLSTSMNFVAVRPVEEGE